MAVGAMFLASPAPILIAASAITICACGYFCLGGTVDLFIDVDGTQRPRADSAAPYTDTGAHALLTMPAARSTPLTPSVCPLCGQSNECAIAAGRPAESCWCMTQAIDPAALAALPHEARGKVCICAACGAPASVAQHPSAAGDPPSPI